MFALIPAGVAYMASTYYEEMMRLCEEGRARIMAMTPEEREALKQKNLREAEDIMLCVERIATNAKPMPSEEEIAERIKILLHIHTQ